MPIYTLESSRGVDCPYPRNNSWGLRKQESSVKRSIISLNRRRKEAEAFWAENLACIRLQKFDFSLELRVIFDALTSFGFVSDICIRAAGALVARIVPKFRVSKFNHSPSRRSRRAVLLLITSQHIECRLVPKTS